MPEFDKRTKAVKTMIKRAESANYSVRFRADYVCLEYQGTDIPLVGLKQKLEIFYDLFEANEMLDIVHRLMEAPKKFPGLWDAQGRCLMSQQEGYPVIYLDKEGNVLCASCATDELKGTDPSRVPVVYDTFWEGPNEHCEGCNCEIGSAYGDPWAEETED